MSYLARLYLAFQEISKNINLVRAFLKDDHQPLGCRARGIRTAGAEGWIYSARQLNRSSTLWPAAFGNGALPPLLGRLSVSV
jgi:hypothetical protein